ncbi:MAG TPA: glycoside hydrolase family 36 N-terminal domain-containing protein, partial [Anaerolineales bacterium]|nr:glycoside hydrolase family 36 N-terminal domain-containing protein [Anaerolineales bacterium]
HPLPTHTTTPRQTLCVVLKDAVQALHVTLCYRITPEHDVIERWLELENHGSDAILLDVCYSASLHLPNGT